MLAHMTMTAGPSIPLVPSDEERLLRESVAGIASSGGNATTGNNNGGAAAAISVTAGGGKQVTLSGAVAATTGPGSQSLTPAQRAWADADAKARRAR